MTFPQFAQKLKHRYGASSAVALRLWNEGAHSAADAHRDMFEAGELPDVKTEVEFSRFCHSIGAEFVLDNIGYPGALFEI